VRLYRWLTPVGYELSIASLPCGTLSFGPVVIRTARTNHNPESIALRIEENGASSSRETRHTPSISWTWPGKQTCWSPNAPSLKERSAATSTLQPFSA